MSYEPIFIVILFLIYLVLWAAKRITQRKQTGIDPEVFRKSSDPLQQYMYRVSQFLTGLVILLIFFHSLDFQFYLLFSRFPVLDYFQVDLIGFVIGLIGLTICAIAQRKMGNSWRVGIDEEHKTELVTTGIFKYVRNPTYSGIMLLMVGLWLIWSTWTIGLFVIIFYFFLEVQVRCEEGNLLKTHGTEYAEYCSKTGRYFRKLFNK